MFCRETQVRIWFEGNIFCGKVDQKEKMSETEAMDVDPEEGSSKKKSDVENKNSAGYEMPW